jgi:hypothetical protein
VSCGLGVVPVWTVGCERLCSPLHDFSWAKGSYATAPMEISGLAPPGLAALFLGWVAIDFIKR